MEKSIQACRTEKVGDYLYALWPNVLYPFTVHECELDVVRVKKRRFLFWKYKSYKTVAVFKIKLK